MTEGWTGLPMAQYTRWRRVFNDMFTAHELSRAAACPLCGKGTLYLAFALQGPEIHRRLDGDLYRGHGQVWEWCDTCRTCTHTGHTLVPDWGRPHTVPSDTGLRDPSRVIPLLPGLGGGATPADGE